MLNRAWPGFLLLTMIKFIIGKKLGMHQIFRENKAIPVTIVEAGPCWVVRKKEEDKDGYQAIQVGFQKKGEKYRYLREFRVDPEGYKIGQEIKADVFQAGDQVKAQSMSKGKGFQGAVKRWGFSGQNASHGGKGDVRKLGSIGSGFPQRVRRGRKMPGQMGYYQTTVRNLDIVEVDPEHNLLIIKGPLPGVNGALVKIESL